MLSLLKLIGYKIYEAWQHYTCDLFWTPTGHLLYIFVVITSLSFLAYFVVTQMPGDNGFGPGELVSAHASWFRCRHPWGAGRRGDPPGRQVAGMCSAAAGWQLASHKGI